MCTRGLPDRKLGPQQRPHSLRLARGSRGQVWPGVPQLEPGEETKGRKHQMACSALRRKGLRWKLGGPLSRKRNEQTDRQIGDHAKSCLDPVWDVPPAVVKGVLRARDRRTWWARPHSLLPLPWCPAIP